MKYLAAYTLLTLSGKANPSEDDLSKFLKSLDCEVNQEQLKACVTALSGKQLHELCNQGMSKLGSMNVGGGSGAKAQGEAVVEEEEKEPTVEEESEDMDMGDLFG